MTSGTLTKQVVYWSSTGVTNRVAKLFDGDILDNYSGGEYVLLFPSYGQPRTGNHVPPQVKKFLREHHGNLIGVIGVGNVVFGPEFCLGAKKVARKFGVPLLATIDVVPTAQQIETINKFLKGELNVGSTKDGRGA